MKCSFFVLIWPFFRKKASAANYPLVAIQYFNFICSYLYISLLSRCRSWTVGVRGILGQDMFYDNNVLNNYVCYWWNVRIIDIHFISAVSRSVRRMVEVRTCFNNIMLLSLLKYWCNEVFLPPFSQLPKARRCFMQFGEKFFILLALGLGLLYNRSRLARVRKFLWGKKKVCLRMIFGSQKTERTFWKKPSQNFSSQNLRSACMMLLVE